MKTPPVSEKFLTFSNYKEPLRSVPNGHGYMGTVALSLDKKSIQCHVCGGLFRSLAFHIRSAHGLTVKAYRKIFELSPQTALVSEQLRLYLKQKTLDWIKTLTPEEKEEYRRKSREGRRRSFAERRYGSFYQPKITLETKNKRGTCPDQLLAKIQEVAEKLGYTPSLAEFIHVTGGQRYKHLIFATFGSWKKALEVGKFPAKETKKVNKSVRYDDEELLEHLRIYQETYHKVPTHTDCKRGLIPSEYSYQRFGGLIKARILAGIEMPPLKKGWKGGYERPTVQAVLESV